VVGMRPTPIPRRLDADVVVQSSVRMMHACNTVAALGPIKSTMSERSRRIPVIVRR
jgi:hypothetical protein